MSILNLVIGGGVIVAGVAAYRLYKAKKAVTAASVVAQVKADALAAKADVAAVKADISKL
jgi:hypothetical protein